MGKAKLQPLAQILKLVDLLNESDRLVLYDYLRPERARSKSKSAQSAGGKSKQSGQQKEPAASSETGKGDAGDAALGASGGD